MMEAGEVVSRKESGLGGPCWVTSYDITHCQTAIVRKNVLKLKPEKLRQVSQPERMRRGFGPFSKGFQDWQVLASPSG